MTDQQTDWPAIWRDLITGAEKSWVVFENGTCVVLAGADPDADLAAGATALLREYGPVRVGTPSADFDLIELDGYPGWVVTCHHPDILNYVPPQALTERAGPPEVLAGLFGRSARDEDARQPAVLHVHDARPDTARESSGAS
jgi:hypothetical protein